ncbi:HAD family hydrolase [Acaryochloris sp. IP29b_bin.137]|uniref:HAD-IIB family hydrolase n=1 Tax=Acaryochloris sp. IP29b_bin.137 TaxID=2969217 RepID=UPI00261FE72D|nr:HAD family hydrolase [Acaryochloris sp. IP29b_bin.137]
MSNSILKLAEIHPQILNGIKLIATDMDGTLTVEGKFPPALGQALWDLQSAGYTVVIVTGRSAGWVSGLAHYLPIQGAIAENGGLFFHQPDTPGKVLSDIPGLKDHRTHLAKTFRQLQTQFPHLRTTADNAFRITDWTFDNPGFDPVDLEKMAQLCATEGFDFTYSTVQCHIKPQGQNKQAGLLTVLTHHLPEQYDLSQVLTIGDSPNDQDLFDPQVFSLSIGVANLSHYLGHISHHPQAMTQAAEGLGFLEITQRLLSQ